MGNIKRKLILDKNSVKLIVYDFDGVMTDNKVILSEDGRESVVVNRADGLAIAKIKAMGIKQVIISTEKNKVVEKRAKKLNIDFFYGIDDKKTVLERYLKDNNIKKSKVIYVGNDINDLNAMKLVKFKIAPADAAEEIKEIATFITNAKGGEGIIREIMDFFNNNKE